MTETTRVVEPHFPRSRCDGFESQRQQRDVYEGVSGLASFAVEGLALCCVADDPSFSESRVRFRIPGRGVSGGPIVHG
jgi:hypothetical protein